VTMTMGKFSSGTEYWKVGWEGILLKRARMTWMRRCHKIEQNSLSLYYKIALITRLRVFLRSKSKLTFFTRSKDCSLDQKF
jgi:hypothetical protein